MPDVPVKEYRVRRAKKWGLRTLIPFGVRASKVRARWRESGGIDWPPSGWGGGIFEAEQLAVMQSLPYPEV